MRLYVLAALASVVLAALSPALSQAAVGPSVRDVVEFTSIVLPHAHDLEAMRRQTSPDGTRAFIVSKRSFNRVLASPEAVCQRATGVS